MQAPVPDTPPHHEPEIASITEAPKPWGPGATVAFTLLILVVMLVIQVFIAIGFAASAAANHRPLSFGDIIENGAYLSVALCLTSLICCPLIALLAALRRLPLREYLGLVPVSLGTVATWVVVVLLVCALSDGLSLFFGRPIVPRFAKAAYETTGFYPLLWMAFVVAAPLFEELLFRGFLFKGLLQAKSGVSGAILFTSLGWAALHLQYDFFEIAQVFVVGLLLGFVRARTKSIYPTLAMHATANIVATIETALQHKWTYH